LTPVDKFFFGGEITFLRSKIINKDKNEDQLSSDERELRIFDKLYSSYVVKSNPFPQQTSLLGMLRFVLLSNDKKLFAGNKIVGEKKDVTELIGEKSFHVNDSNFGTMDFGKIKQIYPCFIQRKTADTWEDLVFAPFDFPFRVRFEKGVSFLDAERSIIPVIEGYNPKDPKKGIQYQYINETDVLNVSDLFKEDIRIGINRDFKGKTEDDAYYKQVFYRFSDKYKISENNFINHSLRFAFYADLDYLPETENQIVSLGGDNSRFCLNTKAVSETDGLKIPNKYVNNQNFDCCCAKIVLLSDAFIGREDIKNCLFSINETVAFRFLTSTVDTTNYYMFAGTNRLQRNEQKYELYKCGSVFYFENDQQLEKFETALKKDRFIQIGYNNYKLINNINHGRNK
jgi:CRISPR-associated protein Cmr3